MSLQLDEIRIWHIYLCPTCNASDPPKDKYVVVVCKKKEEAWGFFINSEIPRFIKISPALLNTQVVITPNEYEFLDHESFIGCNDLKRFFAWELRRHKGGLRTETKANVLAVVNATTTLSAEEKQAILMTA